LAVSHREVLSRCWPLCHFQYNTPWFTDTFLILKYHFDHTAIRMHRALLVFSFCLSLTLQAEPDSLQLRTMTDRPCSDLSITYQVPKDSYGKEGRYTLSYKKHLLESGLYAAGLKEGAWKFYSMTDALRYEGHFKKGRKDGDWTAYYEDGKVAAKEYFKNGSREKTIQAFYENGNPSFEKPYTHDSLNGLVTWYYENGKRSETRFFVMGEATGPAKRYYESGGLKEEKTLVAGKRDSLYTFYYENGTLWEEILYKQGNPYRVAAYNDSLGHSLLTKISLKDGNGTMRFFDKKGLMTREETFKNSLLEGYSKSWTDGKLTSEGNFKLDKKEGLWKYYYDKGILKSKINYKNNLADGEEVHYYNTGEIYYRQQSKEGKADGTYRSFTEEGKLKTETNYSKGIQEGETRYYENGKLVSAGRFVLGQKSGVWRYFDLFGKSTWTNEYGPSNGTAYELQEPIATKDGDPIYYAPDKWPVFPEGKDALSVFIQANLQYPGVSKERGIQGTVWVSFVVTSTGEVTEAKVTRSVEPRLDAEAMSLFKMMPRWEPATLGGEPVATYNRIPVRFVMR
jgi:TonB family protein